MKSTGVIRHIDNLGRLTIPIGLRKNYDIVCGDAMEIYTEGNYVILKKHERCCVFCGERQKLLIYKDRPVCEACRKELSV